MDADATLHCETKPVIYLCCRDVADPVELLAWPGFYSHMTIGGQDAVSGAWRGGGNLGQLPSLEFENDDVIYCFRAKHTQKKSLAPSVVT